MITVGGFNTAIDKTMELAELRGGGVNRASAVHAYAGGKGLHVARAIGVLGERATLVGIIDRAHRAFFEDALSPVGVAFEGIEVDAVRTCLTIRESSGTRVTEILEPGPVVDDAGQRAVRDAFLARARGSDIAVLSGSVPRGFAEDTYARLVGELPGVRCFVDASGALLRTAADARPFLVKPNREELEVLVSGRVDGVSAAAQSARALCWRGIEVVVVSLGAKGAVLASGGRVCHAVAPARPAANTVGSGDCLLAGIAVGLARGLPAEDVLRLGVACGTANTMSVEHGYVKREHVDEVLPEVTVTWLEAGGVTGRYRWWIGALLFLSTVVNYLDRQTLSVLAPHLKTEFHWTNKDFAWIVIAFRLSYTVMQAVSGRLLDRFGTRNGLSLAVLWYSIIAVLTSRATGFASFCGLRFLLGAGEAANWPAATKAVSEWFPRRERGWAVALFDSGSSVGAALATVLVPFLYLSFGSWRPAFLITGALGFLWLVLWRRHYHPPDTHPRLGAAEREAILADRAEERRGAPPETHETVPAGVLLRLRQTWGAIASRGLTDPVWFMITDWFAIYLVSKGFNLEETAVGFWVPFLAADLGNFFGGGVSSWLIRRGWSVGRARRLLIVAGAFGVLALIPAAFLSAIVPLIACFAIATFSYAVMSTMALSLPADLFESRAVGSVAGLSGAAAGAGTLLSTYLIGVVADRFSFQPILITASLIPFAAAILVVALVRNTDESGRGLLKAI